jgi:protein SCO1/2
MRPRRTLPATLLVLALAACQRGERFDPRGGDQAQADWPRPAPALRLAQDDGAVFDLAGERGKAVVLFFGYTHCPDVCPTTMADFVSVKRDLGARADRVRWVFVSVDWGRDGPAEAMRYARAFDPSFIGLAGDSATLAPIMRGFQVAAFREPGASPETYTVAHSAQVFVVDTRQRMHEPVRWGDDRVVDLRRAVIMALEAP